MIVMAIRVCPPIYNNISHSNCRVDSVKCWGLHSLDWSGRVCTRSRFFPIFWPRWSHVYAILCIYVLLPHYNSIHCLARDTSGKQDILERLLVRFSFEVCYASCYPQFLSTSGPCCFGSDKFGSMKPRLHYLPTLARFLSLELHLLLHYDQ